MLDGCLVSSDQKYRDKNDESDPKHPHFFKIFLDSLGFSNHLFLPRQIPGTCYQIPVDAYAPVASVLTGTLPKQAEFLIICK